MKPNKEQIRDFFIDCKKMSEKLLKISPKSINYNQKNWQYRINPVDMSKIFQWICDNQSDISSLFETSPHKTLCKYKATGLYLTFELINDDEGAINLLLNSHSKLAATTEGKRQKEPELTVEEAKAGKSKGKLIYRGGYKEVQYCFQWQAGMDDLAPYTASVFKSSKGAQEIKQEKRFRELLGKNFSNQGMVGLSRGSDKYYFYAPLAVSDQKTWSEDKGINGLKGMNYIPFLTVLYKQALILAKFQKTGIIWRDLKGRNFLMVPNSSKNSVNPIAIDFSHSRTTTDDKNNLENDFGTRGYYSPWNDKYISFRKMKYDELKLTAELQNQPLDFLDHYFIGIQQCKNGFHALTELAKSQYGNDCIAAINAINSYSKLDDLKAPTVRERHQFRFLSSHRDDAWAFSKLMTELIAIRHNETQEPELKTELKELYYYFQANMHKPWQEIDTGEKIVTHLTEMFKKMGISIFDRGSIKSKVIEEVNESKKNPKSIQSTSFLLSTKKTAKETYFKMPGSFMF